MALYALHYDWHIHSTLDMIDAWHCRLLRRTLRYKTTMIDRSKTNNFVYRQSKSLPLSHTITQRQVAYYGHIARHPETLAHKVTFGPPLTLRTLNTTRRRGRPRHHWAPHAEHAANSFLATAGKVAHNRQQTHNFLMDSEWVKSEMKRQTAGRVAQHAPGPLSGGP